MSKKKQYLNGVRAGVPVILGYIPVGIAYGIMARQAGFTLLQTGGMSVFVFAGASQMMAVGMYAQGASIAAMIITTFILNLRHIIMSVCIMNRMRSADTKTRLLAAFGVTDESFAVFTTEKEENISPAFFFGLFTSTYASWVVGSLIGAVSSDILPELLTASLGIALYAMFIGLLVPDLTKNWRLAALAVLTALCNFLFTQFMSSSRALIISALLCAFIGVFFVDLNDENEGDNTDDRS